MEGSKTAVTRSAPRARVPGAREARQRLDQGPKGGEGAGAHLSRRS
jgi:hypothetical protein